MDAERRLRTSAAAALSIAAIRAQRHRTAAALRGRHPNCRDAYALVGAGLGVRNSNAGLALGIGNRGTAASRQNKRAPRSEGSRTDPLLGRPTDCLPSLAPAVGSTKPPLGRSSAFRRAAPAERQPLQSSTSTGLPGLAGFSGTLEASWSQADAATNQAPRRRPLNQFRQQHRTH